MAALKNGSELSRVSPRLEVHCVGVCRSPDGKVLIAQRLSTKSVHPDKWEFGCAQLRPGDNFSDAIKRDYRDDFGANVDSVDLDEPLGTYSFPRANGIVPGLILAATVTNPAECKVVRHQALQWVDPANIPADLPKVAVPDFGLIMSKLATRAGKTS
jgi:isopentenyldiphosphate isomerase